MLDPITSLIRNSAQMASIQGISVSPQSIASQALVAAGESIGDLSSSIAGFGTMTSDQKIAVAIKMTADNITARHNDIMQQCASQAADLYRSAVVSVLSAEDVKMLMDGHADGQTARIIVVDFTMPQDMQRPRAAYSEPSEAGMINWCECVSCVVCGCVLLCV